MSENKCARLTGRCIHVLESMKDPLNDSRPKTLTKLRNVLRKEGSVTFQGSILNAVFTSPDQSLEICHVTQIQLQDEELNGKIIEVAKQISSEKNRRLHILAPNSNLYAVIERQLTSWYMTRDSVNSADPVRDLAKACMVEHDLSADQVATDLERFGLAKFGPNSVELSLPDELAKQELQKVLSDYRAQFGISLEELSIKSYYYLSRLLANANMNISQASIRTTALYCKHLFNQRFPGYTFPKQTSTFLDMAQLNLSDMETNQSEECSIEELPQTTSPGLPIAMTSEICDVVITLLNSEIKPTSVPEVLSAMTPACRLLYVVSPKYILPGISKGEEQIRLRDGEDFSIKLNLGNQVEKHRVQLSDTSALARVLALTLSKTVNGKHKSNKSRVIPRSDAMETDQYEHEEVTFQKFQDFVLEQGEVFAQRRQSTLELNHPGEDTETKQRLDEWLRNINPNEEITEKAFVNTLCELSRRIVQIPADNIINMLEKEKYIEVSQDGTIKYLTVPRMFYDHGEGSLEVSSFKTQWKKDYTPSGQAHHENVRQISGRKRISSYLAGGGGTHKRMKVITI